MYISESNQHYRRDVSVTESSPTNVTTNLRTSFELVRFPNGYIREQL